MNIKIVWISLILLSAISIIFLLTQITVIEGRTTYEAYNLSTEEIENFKSNASKDPVAAERLYNYYKFVKRDSNEAEKWKILTP